VIQATCSFPDVLTPSSVLTLISSMFLHMDALFDDVNSNIDCSVLTALDICHLAKVDDMYGNSVMEYVAVQDLDLPSNAASGDIVMEAVGFTQGDHSAQSREKMKLHVLAYVLDCKHFLLTRSGNKFIADNDPGLMSYLFPRLNPWDIGGFRRCGRTPKQHLSMEAQVRNLLLQDDSPFKRDDFLAPNK
jgi:hypothetical protein